MFCACWGRRQLGRVVLKRGWQLRGHTEVGRAWGKQWVEGKAGRDLEVKVEA